MTRAFGICVAVASLLAGCVSVSGPSAEPSLGSSLGITTPAPFTTGTPAASASPTQAPVATATPTAIITAAPTATPTLTPTNEPTETPGASQGDLVLFDDMEDPSSGWGLSQTDTVGVAYEEGALRIRSYQQNMGAYSGRLLGGEYGVVLVAAEFEPGAVGAVAVLCSAADGTLYGAALTTNGAVLFISIVGGQIVILDRNDEADIALPLGESTVFGLECTGTSTGALRLVAILQDEGALGVYQTDEGPSAFNGVAVYGEAFSDSFAVDVEQVGAYAIEGSADGMTPEAEELLTHVPQDWHETCIDTPSTNEATAVVSCFLQANGVGAELAVFQQYSTNAGMDSQYQDNVDLFGVDSTGSCESGPNETTWSIEEDTFGRLQCAPQKVGIRFDWTDDRLEILSTLFDFDGDYENTYQLWLDAGPTP